MFWLLHPMMLLLLFMSYHLSGAVPLSHANHMLCDVMSCGVLLLIMSRYPCTCPVIFHVWYGLVFCLNWLFAAVFVLAVVHVLVVCWQHPMHDMVNSNLVRLSLSRLKWRETTSSALSECHPSQCLSWALTPAPAPALVLLFSILVLFAIVSVVPRLLLLWVRVVRGGRVVHFVAELRWSHFCVAKKQRDRISYTSATQDMAQHNLWQNMTWHDKIHHHIRYGMTGHVTWHTVQPYVESVVCPPNECHCGCCVSCMWCPRAVVTGFNSCLSDVNVDATDMEVTRQASNKITLMEIDCCVIHMFSLPLLLLDHVEWIRRLEICAACSRFDASLWCGYLDRARGRVRDKLWDEHILPPEQLVHICRTTYNATQVRQTSCSLTIGRAMLVEKSVDPKVHRHL